MSVITTEMASRLHNTDVRYSNRNDKSVPKKQVCYNSRNDKSVPKNRSVITAEMTSRIHKTEVCYNSRNESVRLCRTPPIQPLLLRLPACSSCAKARLLFCSTKVVPATLQAVTVWTPPLRGLLNSTPRLPACSL